MRNYSNEFAISCDWLQIHVKTREDFLEVENPYYVFNRIGQSKTWRNIYEIRDSITGVRIATYCTDNTVMKQNHGCLKFENNQLYCHADLKGFIKTFLERLEFKFVSITRLDIAFDFQKFYMDKSPEVFIRNYVQHKTVRVGSSRKKACVMFQQHNRRHEFQTLYFGSRQSDVQIKMYNKTAELKDNYKPYIEAIHKNTFTHQQPVWRLEFSIYSLCRAKLENEKGELIDYNSLDVLDISKLYGIFIGLFKKYFNFRTVGKAKRVSRMKPLILWIFDLAAVRLNFIRQNELVKVSSRSEKIFLKQLHELAEESSNEQTKQALKDVYKYAVRKLNIKGKRKNESEDNFIRRVQQSVKSDRPEKVFLSKLKKVVSGKEYDDRINEASRDIAGKIISEYNLFDYAERKAIPFTGYEKYIIDVEQFFKLKANEDRLQLDFMRMKGQMEMIEDSEWIKTT